MRRFSMLALPCIVLAATSTQAQVSCADPDNLCTGDPCVISVPTEVLCPCVVDFAGRTLIVDAPLDLGDGCVAQLTAGAIEVRGRIEGRHVQGGLGTGASLTLEAAGDVELAGRIDVAGDGQAGSVTVDAGGNIEVQNRVNATAAGKNAVATGGAVTLEADGTLTTGRKGFIDVRGQKKQTDGGAAVLRGDAGVTTAGKVDAGGLGGGTIEIASSAGAVTLARDVRADGNPGDGGAVTITAQDVVTVDTSVRAQALKGGFGGTVDVVSVGADIVLNQKIRVRGKQGIGGDASLDAAAEVSLEAEVDARGDLGGGSIGVAGAVITVNDGMDTNAKLGDAGFIDLSGGTVAIDDKLEAESKEGSGGGIQIQADGVTMTKKGRLLAEGRLGPGGDIAVVSTTDIVTAASSVITGSTKGAAGGAVVLTAAAGTADVDSKVEADGDPAGSVEIGADVIDFGPKARASAEGGFGEIRFASTSHMLLDGTFLARDGSGVIEGLAGGDLTALGSFRADGGCIGLSAGGVLDTSGASFDEPVDPSCP